MSMVTKVSVALNVVLGIALVGFVVARSRTVDDLEKRLAAATRRSDSEISRLNGELAEARELVTKNKKLVEIAMGRVGFSTPNLIDTPAISAVVQRVNAELKFVMLSVGREDKVKKGMCFHISRDNSYIGEVQVDFVYPKACSASFVTLKDGMSIAPGDNANTRL